MNHGRSERDVKQRRHADAVEIEAGVARVGAAHDVDGRGPDDLLYAREGADDLRGSPDEPATARASSPLTSICGISVRTVRTVVS